MSTSAIDSRRKVIPRWRQIGLTPSKELAAINEHGKSALDDQPDNHLQQKLAQWQATNSLEDAVELLSHSVVAGQFELAEGPARLVASNFSSVGKGVQSLAAFILNSGAVSRPKAELGDGIVTAKTEINRARIRELRQATISYPRNPLIYADLSLLYSSIGQKKSAIKAMEIALAFGQDNRILLRSASRLFLHTDEPDRALQILRTSGLVRQDPWVLAAEISVAGVNEESTKFSKLARNFLNSSRHSKNSTSELAAAFATLELYSGKNKIAKKFFRQSAEDPTENAVAQVRWASQHMHNFDFNPVLLRTPGSYEARAHQSFYAGQWESVIENCQSWANDEIFSTRPIDLASYVAATAMGDYELCERLARNGLLANPGEPTLLNNLCFSLVQVGRLDEAKAHLDKIENRPVSKELAVTLFATKGLIEYRRGNIEEGRRLYEESIAKSKELETDRVGLMATLHWINEELSQSEPIQSIFKIEKELESKIEETPFKEVEAVFERVHEKVVARKNLDGEASPT